MFAVFATFAEAVDLRGASWIDNWLAQPQLMGNWFGARAALAGWGITPIVRYGPDMQANVLGGQRRGKAYAGDFAIDVTVDLEKLSGARGLTFGVSGDWTKSGIRFRWNLLPDVLACLRKQVKVLGDAEKNEPSLFGPGAFAEPEPESAATAEGPCADRLVDVLGENLKAFPTDFLAGVGGKGTRIRLPGESLRLEQENTGAWILKTQDGVFAKVRKPAEGNFILYAQMRGIGRNCRAGGDDRSLQSRTRTMCAGYVPGSSQSCRRRRDRNRWRRTRRGRCSSGADCRNSTHDCTCPAGQPRPGTRVGDLSDD